MKPHNVALGLIVLIASATGSSGQETRMTPELLWQLGRLGETAVSADGRSAIYTVRRYELSENKGRSTLYLLTLDDLTSQPLVENWSSINSVQWAPYGDKPTVYFIGLHGNDSEEGESDDQAESEESPQVWRLDPESKTLEQVTRVEDGLANLKVSPTGKHLAFTADIKLDETVNDLYEDLPKADARIIDQLMFRHWDHWHDYKYTHLHVAPINADGSAGDRVDLMEGLKADCPVPPFGGSEQFAWSPEGTEVAYTAKIVPRWAESTNSDVYVLAINDDGTPRGTARNISTGMEGYDNNPFYSPDGRYMAFHSMQRPSFESDRNRIMLYDRKLGSIRELTAGLDQNANGGIWSPDSKSITFVSEYRGSDQLFRMGVDGRAAEQVTDGAFNWDLVDVLPDASALIVTKTSMLRPAELVKLSANGGQTTLTEINDAIYEDLQLPTIQERWVDATDGKKIHCWVIYPPDFDESKEWPLLTYCQGGPQGQIGQWFSYRWNFHLMAANGYVVLAPNRRGLPGFGRQWNDQISGDWGGQAMQDLLSATDEMLQEKYIDDQKTAAIGASFGGYTVYWMMGHHQDRFKTMIAHCGVFNLESMYGSTEELFFVNWDLGGPYWKSPDVQKDYDRFSPHRFVQNWETPLLVIHGEKDFRVPVTQGMEAFTAAQVQGVPSRFLYFPGEGHWVLQPQNGVLWHRVFFDWLARYCK